MNQDYVSASATNCMHYNNISYVSSCIVCLWIILEATELLDSDNS